MGDAPNYAAFAMPIFAVAIAVELWVARRRGRVRELYALGTAVSDIGCGAVFQALEVVLTLVTLAGYAWLHEHASVVEWASDSPWPWVVGMVGVDFLYYWWHRISHVSNVMWAVHGVHHQSEDYNLAVALRQPIAEPITLMLFFWVLAIAGVPPLVFVISFGANLFYQFWIHTELITTLPRPVEWVLNTPSHHRVHHGVDANYLDRNYGGVLVIWDRLFGSFQAEQQRPTYGTTVPLRSYDPLWGNAQHLHRTWQLSRAASRWSDKLWAWFAHPAWLPRGVADPAPKPSQGRPPKYRPEVSPARAWYVGGSLLVVAGVGAPFVYWGHLLPLAQILVTAVVLVASHVALNGLVEAKPWAPMLDWLRIVALSATAGWLVTTGGSATLGISIAAGVLVVSVAGRLASRPRATATP